jgi:Fic-DOC domain mobile mystery protein B
MGLALRYNGGQTPLDANETEGLLIKTITTQRELNEAEQLSIAQAIEWTLRKRFVADDILSEAFIWDLHKRMYKAVWRWAGEFRRTDKNIGIDKHQIAVELRMLIDNCKFWMDHQTFPPDEIAIRFKHRIVSIHCFPNGNGRHSRLMADVIVKNLFDLPVFTWGSKVLHQPGEGREHYLKALKAADQGAVENLLAFARS